VRRLHNEELHKPHGAPNNRVTNMRMRGTGQLARMGDTRNAYTTLVGKPEGKRLFGRTRRRWENIKMDLREGKVKIKLSLCFF
jgi:hypothetical protein